MKSFRTISIAFVLVVGLVIAVLVFSQSQGTPVQTAEATATTDTTIDANLDPDDQVVNALSNTIDLRAPNLFQTEAPEQCGIYIPDEDAAESGTPESFESQCAVDGE